MTEKPVEDMRHFLQQVFGDDVGEDLTDAPLSSNEEQLVRVFADDRAARNAAVLLHSAGLIDLGEKGEPVFRFNETTLESTFCEAFIEYRASVAKHEEARNQARDHHDIDPVTMTVLDRKRSRLHNAAATTFADLYPEINWDHETIRRWIAAMVRTELPWIDNRTLPVDARTVRALEPLFWMLSFDNLAP